MIQLFVKHQNEISYKVRETDIYFKQSSDVSQTEEMTQSSLEMTMFKYSN